MKRFCFLLIFSLIEITIQAASNIRITPVPSLPQLPVSAIHRIFQDSEGLMWYGTVNGLCCDDGYQINVIRSDINTPGLLNDNTIQSIAEDERGRIWFGTDHGAYMLDKTSRQVTPLDAERLQASFIYSIRKTSDGAMWIATGHKLLRYNTEGKLQKTYLLYDHEGKSSWMAGFCESRQKQILITVGREGIYRYDKKTDTFTRYANPPSGRNLTCIVQDRTRNYFWVGTSSDGLLLFDPSAPKDSIYTYSPLPVNPMGEAEGDILYLEQDNREGILWMTTRSSLIAMRYDEARRCLRQTDFSLPTEYGSMLNEIYQDKDGNLWAGTNNGVFAFSLHNNQWHTVCDTLGLVSAIKEDKRGNKSTELPPASFRNSRKKGIHLNQKRGKNESDPSLKHFIPLFGAFYSPALKRISLHLNHQPLYSDLTKNKLIQHEKRDFISCCTGHLFVFLRSDF